MRCRILISTGNYCYDMLGIANTTLDPYMCIAFLLCAMRHVCFRISVKLKQWWLLDNYQCWFCCFLSRLGYTASCMLPIYISIYRPGHGSADTADFRMRRKSRLGTLHKTIRPMTYRGHGSTFTADFRQRQKSTGDTLRKTIRPVTRITSKTANFRTRRKSYVFC